MWSNLCCLRGPDDDDGEAPGCCACLPWPFSTNTHNPGAAARHPRAYTRVAPVPLEASAGSAQEDPLNTFRCPPMPLPYDDPRFRHPTEKSILLGERSNADAGSTRDDGDEKADGQPSSLEAQPGGGKPGGTQVVCVDCDEDDCPICLEEYDYENPKTLLQCNHDFHLGCIYEWMERSQSCPVCAVVMMFKEDQNQ